MINSRQRYEIYKDVRRAHNIGGVGWWMLSLLAISHIAKILYAHLLHAFALVLFWLSLLVCIIYIFMPIEKKIKEKYRERVKLISERL